jgi:carbamoyl-phosphate synthase small subunit
MNGQDLAKRVTCTKRYMWELPQIVNYKIAAIDFGIKHNILRLLESHGCSITVFPANTNADDLLNFDPDGIFLSNGPGDPAAVTYGIETVKKLLGKKPIFGICLGHQILALALGGSTYKLKFGHRGCNHPVKNLQNNIVEITSQNHGFSVDPESLPENIEITHTSLNDQTVEGIRCKDLSAFSVQYHPESSPGPHDSRYLFEEFINMISPKKVNA